MTRLINVLVTITLIELMVAIGLRVTFAELLVVGRNWGLVARGALANYVCVPAVTAIAKGDVAVAVGLMLLLAASSAVIAPLLLGSLLPLLSAGDSVRVDVTRIVVTPLGHQQPHLKHVRWSVHLKKTGGPSL